MGWVWYDGFGRLGWVWLALVNIALYCSKTESRVSGGGVVGGCKAIFVSNPQPSCFGLLLGWVAVAWLGFGVMTTNSFGTI